MVGSATDPFLQSHCPVEALNCPGLGHYRLLIDRCCLCLRACTAIESTISMTIALKVIELLIKLFCFIHFVI